MTENEKSDRVKEVDEVLKNTDRVSKDRERIIELEEEVNLLNEQIRMVSDQNDSLIKHVKEVEHDHIIELYELDEKLDSGIRADNLYDQQKVDLLKELSYNLTLEQLQNFVGIAKSSKTGTWKTQ